MKKNSKKEKLRPMCALCKVQGRLCARPAGQGPEFRPTKNQKNALKTGLKKYARKETMRFAKAASLQEAESYVRRDERPFVPAPRCMGRESIFSA